jgi:hypothetical protein
MGSIRPRDLSTGQRARAPTRGIRNKLRTHLRALGAIGKFRTDEMRDGTLVVIGECSILIDEFEGRIVRYKK